MTSWMGVLCKPLLPTASLRVLNSIECDLIFVVMAAVAASVAAAVVITIGFVWPVGAELGILPLPGVVLGGAGAVAGAVAVAVAVAGAVAVAVPIAVAAVVDVPV